MELDERTRLNIFLIDKRENNFVNIYKKDLKMDGKKSCFYKSFYKKSHKFFSG